MWGKMEEAQIWGEQGGTLDYSKLEVTRRGPRFGRRHVGGLD